MHIYIHIPFCRQKCTYCKFALTPVYTDIQKKRYLAHLKHEISLHLSEQSIPEITTIYFWWWTPSILTLQEIREILALLPTQSIQEISFEMNPEDITEEYARWLRELGITRVSMWVQTLNTESLQAIQRAPREVTLRAIDILWKIGFQSINVDFILGLPHVKRWETLSDIQYIHTLVPIYHTSVYILENELYPADWQENSIDTESLRQEYIDISTYLSGKWWNHYELSNWAVPGYESIHNRWYWNHASYRGFWLSASSYEGNHRWTNSLSFQWYYRWEKEDEEFLTDWQIQIEKLMFWLRTTGISGEDLSPAQIQVLEKWQSTGEIRRVKNIFSLNSSWIFLLDYIMSELV